MFGIKTKIVKRLKSEYNKNIWKGKISSDLSIRHLMTSFRADEIGHLASISKADLGFGWIHYGIIRSIKPKRILCIGSRHGYVPAILAQACKDSGGGYVDFVDPGYGAEDKNNWTGVGFWKQKEGMEIFKKYGLGKWIKIYLMTSQCYEKKFPKRKYDYVYVDGDHSYKGVTSDYLLFWPKINKHGFISFHDISVKGRLPEGTYGVHKLWEKISKKGSIVFPYSKSGLGILQKIK